MPRTSIDSKAGDQVKYPDTGAFQVFNTPCRLEGDIFDLEIDGKTPPPPPEINGTFYRRYVRSYRFLAEIAVRKSLFGRYRNPFKDPEAVKGEDGPPYAMDPVTLETIVRYDFEGQVRSPTFTAHPKFDPETGEILCFGYEAGGDGQDGSCGIVVYTWYKALFCGMVHDCGISKNYAVLPMTLLKCLLDWLKNGGEAWDPDAHKPLFRGLTRILLIDDGFAHEELNGKRGLEFPTRARGGLASPDANGEFSRINDRCVTKKNKHFWQATVDGAQEYNAAGCGSPAGGLFNCIGNYTWDKGMVLLRGAWLTALLNHLDVLRNNVVILDAFKVAAGLAATIYLPVKLCLGLHGNFVYYVKLTPGNREDLLGGTWVLLSMRRNLWGGKWRH
ncbi:retinal pigment epithelial membrane protein-domain-containing protein [Phialemonium atrogriseum]|uniref:Retinal pigment epithelial membrane protein-domain-containing protein n=1 Tax=Phialemonium atrogriseum TaxID=1093897 RepID=A0AAJ0BNX2_9PEZI|nr:retinal pigment epithelial membrane protein-domain-containing protein [Phialemonium atrogriseum]KAK1761780.1 retinal pigment epithelial membrane protein-domain-containing protein [Phialemonium atrogriseum]